MLPRPPPTSTKIVREGHPPTRVNVSRKKARAAVSAPVDHVPRTTKKLERGVKLAESARGWKWSRKQGQGRRNPSNVAITAVVESIAIAITGIVASRLLHPVGLPS